jgi:RNA polymerase sigma-70 factor (ECF subfamily)
MERSGDYPRSTIRVLRLLKQPTSRPPDPGAELPEIPPLLASAGAPRYHATTLNDQQVPSAATLHRAMLGHADALYNLARHLTSDAGDAEDLVQETFIRALRAAPEARETYLRPWLFRILRNAFYDLYRRDKKQPPLERLEDEAATNDGSWRGDAEIQLLRGAVARDIEAALARLSDDGRTVLLLDVEGFTETEIADIMQCPLGTVKSRLMRARANLRKQLWQYAK